MKKDLHPGNYRLVVFKDFSVDEAFITRSCAPTRDTIVWEDGKVPSGQNGNIKHVPSVLYR